MKTTTPPPPHSNRAFLGLNKVLGLIFFGILCFTSCSKEELQSENPHFREKSETDLKIEAFGKRLKEAKDSPVKANETLSIEEGVWNLEALLNYINPVIPENEDSKDYKVVQSSYLLNMTGERIELGEILAAKSLFESEMNLQSLEKMYISDIHFSNQGGVSILEFKGLKMLPSNGSNVVQILQNGYSNAGLV